MSNTSKKKKAVLLGVGLDSDGHKRLTTGPNFALVGGSQDTHEQMTEKAVKIGERLIIAQLMGVDGEVLVFSLMSSQTQNAELWWKAIPELKADKPLRKNRATLAKRNPERRPWGSADGEPARSISGGSKFLK